MNGARRRKRKRLDHIFSRLMMVPFIIRCKQMAREKKKTKRIMRKKSTFAHVSYRFQ